MAGRLEGMTEAVVLDYRESPASPGLAGDVACLWTQHVSPGSSPAVHRVLPDGCIDLIWGLDNGVQVAGPDTGPVLAALHPGVRITGLRFRPGRAPRFLGVPASELVDGRAPLGDLWGNEAALLAERLAEAPSQPAAHAAFEAAVHDRLATAEAPDPLIAAIVHRLTAYQARVAALAWDLGVSERQLLRRCEKAVGYGPKKLDRVLRLRRLLGLASRHPEAGLARLAAESGYADQAHLSRDCRQLTGLAPTALMSGMAGSRP